MLTACFFTRSGPALRGYPHHMPTYCELSIHNAWNSYQQHTHVKFTHARTKSVPQKILWNCWDTSTVMSSASLCSSSPVTVKDSVPQLLNTNISRIILSHVSNNNMLLHFFKLFKLLNACTSWLLYDSTSFCAETILNLVHSKRYSTDSEAYNNQHLLCSSLCQL